MLSESALHPQSWPVCRFWQAEQSSGGRPGDNDVTDASLMGSGLEDGELETPLRSLQDRLSAAENQVP